MDRYVLYVVFKYEFLRKVIIFIRKRGGRGGFKKRGNAVVSYMSQQTSNFSLNF